MGIVVVVYIYDLVGIVVILCGLDCVIVIYWLGFEFIDFLVFVIVVLDGVQYDVVLLFDWQCENVFYIIVGVCGGCGCGCVGSLGCLFRCIIGVDQQIKF